MRHIVETNLGGRNVSAAYDVANAWTEGQLTSALSTLEKTNEVAYKYILENVGLNSYARVRLVQHGGRLYGKESGVMANDAECSRFKSLGIRDAMPTEAIIRYHQLLYDIIQKCIVHADYLKSSGQILSQFAHKRLTGMNVINHISVYTLITYSNYLAINRF